jgi:hypothetical protein
MKPLRFKPKRLACALTLVCGLLSCGLTALAAEPTQEIPRETTPPAVTASLPSEPKESAKELYPSDVKTVVTDTGQQIIKTYILTAEQNPADIPREGFARDGWRYALTDITEKRISGTDIRAHTETTEISTGTNDLNAVIALLAPTLKYQSEDGYAGLLTLDLASVKCEAAGYKNSGYTVTATREYPHLSTNDLSLIPKTISENGRTLNLEDVSWEAQNTVNVDYEDIPESYRAVAKYTAKASKTVATGYITTADYSGEIGKAVTGDTTYTAYFTGSEINPSPKATPGQSVMFEPETPGGALPGKPLLIGLAALIALIGGAAAFYFLRHNVKIYAIRESGRSLIAKDRIGAKRLGIDLSPLDGSVFGLLIDRFTAKTLNGKNVEIVYGPVCLKHKIAYEGGVYNIEVDFKHSSIKAVY